MASEYILREGYKIRKTYSFKLKISIITAGPNRPGLVSNRIQILFLTQENKSTSHETKACVGRKFDLNRLYLPNLPHRAKNWDMIWYEPEPLNPFKSKRSTVQEDMVLKLSLLYLTISGKGSKAPQSKCFPASAFI